MQRVFVLSSDRQPLDPCHPARARQLLKAGRAAVFRRYPFTIILKGRTAAESTTHPHRVKLDPGSKTTGIAVVAEDANAVVWAAEVQHRGAQIKACMDRRRALRRARRSRKTRYREPRFDNRASSRRKGRLAPSLESRVENVVTWVERMQRYCPVGALSLELTRFDTQKMENPEISGVQYQQGELFGYKVREYLLEKWGHKCAYCGATNVPLEVEHVIPRGRGGSDRVSNLTISCHECNQCKGNRTASEYRHPEIEAQAKMPLKDAAAMNSTRWALFRRLTATGLPLEIGTGGRTKYNRTRLGLANAHWTDAVCVGESGAGVYVPLALVPLLIRATGHGKRQRCGTDRYGFPIRHAPRAKKYEGWQTGDLARAVIPAGKHAGVHTGRIAIRHRPSFRLNGINVHPKYLKLLQRADGYEYRQPCHSPFS
jgi:5-methylcytosine-specific restriction endonuclease McrA